MREIQLDALPDGAVTINGQIASFELPNPDNPLKPIQGSAQVVGEALHLFPDRSSIQKRFLAHYGL